MADRIPARVARSIAAGATSVLALVPGIVAAVFAAADAAVALADKVIDSVRSALIVAKRKAQDAENFLSDAFSE